MQVVHPDFGIVIVAAVAVGVDGGDIAVGGILHDGAFTPGVVGVLCDSFAVLVGNGDDVALQVLEEVVAQTTIVQTADGILVVVQWL